MRNFVIIKDDTGHSVIINIDRIDYITKITDRHYQIIFGGISVCVDRENASIVFALIGKAI